MAVQHVLNVHQVNINSNKVKKLAMIAVRANFPLQAMLQFADPVQQVTIRMLMVVQHVCVARQANRSSRRVKKNVSLVLLVNICRQMHQTQEQNAQTARQGRNKINQDQYRVLFVLPVNININRHK